VKFRIVNTEHGLTDLPGWEMTNKVSRQSYDDWDVMNTWYAYDLIDRTAGLQVGDQIDSLVIGNQGIITSVRPQGIIGKVIAKEMQWFYGPFGQKVLNPFSENAYAIATERGSVVPNYKRTAIWEDADSAKNWMDGHTASQAPISSWNYDSRREHDVALTLITNKMNFDPSSGQFQTVSTKLSYYDWGTVPGQSHPNVSMNRRGLNWLAAEHAVNADDATIYAAAMTLSVTMPSVTVTHDRNIENDVLGAMRLVLEVRDAANYRSNDAQEFALPMTLNLDMHGIGAVVAAPVVATLTLTMPNAVALAHGDNVAVYMDSGNTISVFLKEDN
jgi:hypothetical protein